MKYLVIDDCTKYGMDEFIEEFETAKEAIKFAESEFKSLTKSDKSRRANFYVLESQNPDEDAPDHFDGTPLIEYIRDGKELHHDVIEWESGMDGSFECRELKLEDGRKIGMGCWNGFIWTECWFIGRENDPNFELHPIYEEEIIDEEESEFKEVGYCMPSVYDEYMIDTYWINRYYIGMRYSRHENGGYYVD